MVTEFDTFRVKEGKEERAKEWMKIITERKADCIKALTREKMALETIFMTEKDGRLFLSWFSIQGDNPEEVDTSNHEIDRIHCEFWKECIDTTYELDKFEYVVTFSPDNVSSSLKIATNI